MRESLTHVARSTDVRTAVWEKVVETDGENATAKIVKDVVDTVIEAQFVPRQPRRDAHVVRHLT